MGQAKLRGTLQQRVEEGIAKRILQEKIAAEKQRQYRASLTSEDKKKLRDLQTLLAVATVASNQITY